MTHPLTALIAGVPRFCNTSDALMAEDPMGAYVHWHDLIAALEAAPHVNETPKTEHDGADVLSATPPDLVEVDFDAIAYGFWSIHPRDIPEPVGMPDKYKGGHRAWHYAQTMRQTFSALIALATAQAAQIAGLEDAHERTATDLNSYIRLASEQLDGRRAAEAEAATLRAEVERLREAAKALEKAASEVSRRGAETGPQWSKLTIAILQTRAALEGKHE